MDAGLLVAPGPAVSVPESDQEVDRAHGWCASPGREGHDVRCGESATAFDAQGSKVGGVWVLPYMLPTRRRTAELHEESKTNTVGGRLFGWLQRAVVSLGELLG